MKDKAKDISLMLTEQFVASIGAPTKAPASSAVKDASIFIHEYQPHTTLRSIFKKSATPPNCLAVSNSHIFAAQIDKAVVHVCNREKGNQEATVPFTERITCIALACDDSILALGTAEGRIFLWEVTTGRQVTTAQSHFQAVSVLAVDPTSNFLLSASEDSTAQVWSLPSLLSFANASVDPLTPIRTFSAHRTKISALAVGHSTTFSNFAVSASEDGTCHVWDFHTMTVLRTYLLPDTPTCLTVDATDRVVFLGYEDGSIQHLNLYASQKSIRHGNEASAPIQPPQSSRWMPSDKSVGRLMCLSISFDGTVVLSGHESGVILAWDVANRSAPKAILQLPLPGPVTNLSFLPDIGLPETGKSGLRIPAVVKPKFGAFDNSDGTVPISYALNIQLTESIYARSNVSFAGALSAPSFPSALLDDGLMQLQTWGSSARTPAVGDGTNGEEEADFMSLDDNQAKPKQMSMEQQNTALKAELDALRRLQRASFDKMEKMNAENNALLVRERKRLGGSNVNGPGRPANGTAHLGEYDAGSSSESDEG